MQLTEFPSQADDPDGDSQYDELIFEIGLKPKRTRIVTIAYGDAATINACAVMSRAHGREVQHEV